MEITHGVKLSALKPHPLNAEIYGEPNKKLMGDIEKNGLLNPIVINSKNIIISGHRRWKAMQALGFEATDAIIRDFQDELDEQEKLIAYNQQREKTTGQILAETEKLEEIQRERARIRQATSAPGVYGGKPLRETFPEAVKEKGKTLDKIAEKIGAGMCGKQLGKGLKIYKEAKAGNEQAQEALKKLDTKESTITAEYKKLFKPEEKKPVPAPKPELKEASKKVEEPKAKDRKLRPLPGFTEQELKDALYVEDVYVQVDKLYCEMLRRSPEMIRAWLKYWQRIRMERCRKFPEILLGMLEMFNEQLEPTMESLKMELEKEMEAHNARMLS